MGAVGRTWKPARRVSAADLIVFSLLGLITGQMVGIPILQSGEKGAALLLTDVLIGIVLAGGAWLLIYERRLELDRVSLLAFAFAVVGGLSTIASVARFGLGPAEVLFSLAYLGRWLFVFGIYVVVVNCIKTEDVERIWRWIERVTLIFAAFGVFQSLFLPDFAFIVYPDARPYLDWDPQGHRLVSTLLDPNFAGMLLAAVLLVQIGRISFGVAELPWKIGLIAIALALTLSRSAILALLAGLALVLITRLSSRRFWVTISVVAVAAAMTAPWWIPYAASFNKLSLQDPSGLARLISWSWALTVFLDHPFTGVGFNTYGFVHQQYMFSTSAPSTFGLDGGLLFVAVMTGILGLTLFSLMLFYILRNARAGWLRTDLPPELRGIALGAGALIPALVINSLFVNSLLYVPLLHVLWIVWGCSFVAAASLPEELD